jgi:hypothetical protein
VERPAVRGDVHRARSVTVNLQTEDAESTIARNQV